MIYSDIYVRSWCITSTVYVYYLNSVLRSLTRTIKARAVPRMARMDAFLTNQTSCDLLRYTRYKADPRVMESDRTSVSIDEGGNTQWWRSVINQLNQVIDVDKRHPLDVVVPDRKSRVRSAMVNCTVCGRVMPKGAYWSAEFVDSGMFVAMESPAHSFVSLAHALDEAMDTENLTVPEARGLLLAYGYELCGKYAKDAKDPHGKDAHYRIDAATSRAELIKWCWDPRNAGTKGIETARKYVASVKDGAYSPPEAIHATVFGTKPELGGLGMGNVVLNESLGLSHEQRNLVHRAPITPDLQFSGMKRVLEYQGEPHGEVEQHREDASRVQDYGALGYVVFQASADDMKNADTYEAFLRRFAAWMRHDFNCGVNAQIQAVLDDRRYEKPRHALLNALLDKEHNPWRWRIKKVQTDDGPADASGGRR